MTPNILFLVPIAFLSYSLTAADKPVYTEVEDGKGLLQALARLTAAGGTIVLRPGTYRLEQPLRVRHHHTNLRGSGWNTVLQRVGEGDALVFEDVSFCTVRDLLVNGDTSATKGSGIVFRGQCSSNTVDFCRISNFAESGVLFDGAPQRPQSSNTVSRCHFIDNAGDQLRSVANNDFYIVQNQFGAHQRTKERAPRSGVALWPSSAGTYAMNYHWGNQVALRMGPGSHFNRFENNRFEESRRQGVLIGAPGAGACYLNIFTGNTFHTNSQEQSGKWPAVEVYGASDGTFTSNQVFSWDSASILHQHSLVLHRGCAHWIVKDNILRHNVGAAVVFDMADGHIVKDNISE